MAKKRFNRRRFVSRNVPNDGDLSRIMLFNSMAATGFITGSAKKALYAVVEHRKLARPKLSSIHSIPLSLQLQFSNTSKAKLSESDEISEQVIREKKETETKTASIYDEKSGVYIGEMREDEFKRHSFQSITTPNKTEQLNRPRLGKLGRFKTTDDSYSLRLEQSIDGTGFFMKSMEAPSLMWLQGGTPSSMSSPMAYAAGNDYFNCESTTPQRKSRATLISISDIFKKSFKYSQAKIKDRKSSIILVTILMFYFVCRCPLYTSYVVSWMASLSGNFVGKVPDRFDRLFTWLGMFLPFPTQTELNCSCLYSSLQ